MAQENKGQHYGNAHRIAPGPGGSREKSAKAGPVKRFLDWIAKGAAESNVQRTSCPT